MVLWVGGGGGFGFRYMDARASISIIVGRFSVENETTDVPTMEHRVGIDRRAGRPLVALMGRASRTAEFVSQPGCRDNGRQHRTGLRIIHVLPLLFSPLHLYSVYVLAQSMVIEGGAHLWLDILFCTSLPKEDILFH